MNKTLSTIQFPRLLRSHLRQLTKAIDDATYKTANQIVQDIRSKGESAIRRYAQQYDFLEPDSPLVIGATEMQRSLKRVDTDVLELLKRTKQRIESFALAQRSCISDLDKSIPEGRAGHRWLPLQSAGCYAPGGRYPLPSSVLMTCVTARAAGVKTVIVASPNPDNVTIAAAAVAGADKLLRIGGAQAIATLAFGLDNSLPACNVIVGPGNRFVTAAKSIVSRFSRIDMLAGPSELVVATAGDTSPAVVAADLLAQAEHDPDARPFLVTTANDFAIRVREEIGEQLSELPTAPIAAQALKSGGYWIANDIEKVLEICRAIAPEHLSVQGDEFESVASQFEMGAALFVGSGSAEVFGDYGAGPNHTLPTRGSARSNSGLSVLDFMRFQTFLNLNKLQNADSTGSNLIADTIALGRLEGLEAHARSAEMRD